MTRESHDSGQGLDGARPVGTAEAGDSVAGESAMAVGRSKAGMKVCCVCGADVTGQKRYKDGEGRYWCFVCGTKDEERKHPVPCPDCGQNFPKSELKEIEKVEVCPACYAKREQAAKRAAARIAAAEAEALEEQKHRKVMLILAGVLGVLLAVFAGMYLVK